MVAHILVTLFGLGVVVVLAYLPTGDELDEEITVDLGEISNKLNKLNRRVKMEIAFYNLKRSLRKA